MKFWGGNIICLINWSWRGEISSPVSPVEVGGRFLPVFCQDFGIHPRSSWSFQPIWKIWSSKWVHLPQGRDEHTKIFELPPPSSNRLFFKKNRGIFVFWKIPPRPRCAIDEPQAPVRLGQKPSRSYNHPTPCFITNSSVNELIRIQKSPAKRPYAEKLTLQQQMAGNSSWVSFKKSHTYLGYPETFTLALRAIKKVLFLSM